MTQAISFKEVIESNGDTLSSVLIGNSKQRSVPEFFINKIEAPIHTFKNPSFATDKASKSINLYKTIIYNLKFLFSYINSIKKIHKIVKEYNPDFIINFYEPLMGIYCLFYRPKAKVISIAHQYIYLHPEFKFPNGFKLQRNLLVLFTKLTSLASDLKFAISVYPLKNLPDKKLVVVPPLLRSELFNYTSTQENFYLVYLLNQGLSEYIIQWHRRRPEVVLHCFWDKPGVEDEYKYDKTLTFHKLDDKKFLSLMSKCKGLITTAGFESVCEAMYLRKPVFMIPVQGHFEQYCNSRDAYKAGAGMYSDNFEIDKFHDSFIYDYKRMYNYIKWTRTTQDLILNEIEKLSSLENIKNQIFEKSKFKIEDFSFNSNYIFE